MEVEESKNLMTEGTIWKKIIFFALPLFLGNLFQQLYNTADSLIVGNFLGSNARLTCENCDLDGCRKHKKKLFHKTLKEEYRNK